MVPPLQKELRSLRLIQHVCSSCVVIHKWECCLELACVAWGEPGGYSLGAILYGLVTVWTWFSQQCCRRWWSCFSHFMETIWFLDSFVLLLPESSTFSASAFQKLLFPPFHRRFDKWTWARSWAMYSVYKTTRLWILQFRRRWKRMLLSWIGQNHYESVYNCGTGVNLS